MAAHDIVVIGTSAGGVEALTALARGFPADYPAAVFIVMHVSPTSPSLLRSILERHTVLPVLAAQDNDPFQPGRIYVAPPDRHMLLSRDRVRVLRGPKENRHRPAIDPLFRSAAWSHGRRVVGVLLTGMLDDGTSGLWSIKSCGGVTVVQDPADAAFSDMPANALGAMDVDFCLPLERMARLLELLSRKQVSEQPITAPGTIGLEVDAAVLGRDIDDMSKLGRPTAVACPTCRGAMWELHEGGIARYRCHVGHAFMPNSLLREQGEQIETALYSALSVMEEKVALLRKLADQVGEKQHDMADYYTRKADEHEEYAAEIRRLLATRDA